MIIVEISAKLNWRNAWKLFWFKDTISLTFPFRREKNEKWEIWSSSPYAVHKIQWQIIKVSIKAKNYWHYSKRKEKSVKSKQTLHLCIKVKLVAAETRNKMKIFQQNFAFKSFLFVNVLYLLNISFLIIFNWKVLKLLNVWKLMWIIVPAKSFLTFPGKKNICRSKDFLKSKVQVPRRFISLSVAVGRFLKILSN